MQQLHVFLSYLNDKGFSLFLLIFFFDREGYLLCGAISLFGSLLVPLIFQLYKRNKNGKDIVISDNSVEMSTMWFFGQRDATSTHSFRPLLDLWPPIAHVLIMY